MHKALDCVPSTKTAAVNLNKIYNDRIKKDPLDIEAYIGWADVLSHIDRKDESAKYYVSSANIMVEAGDKATAKKLYEKALNVMPSNCDANFMYGTMILDDGMLREAAPYLLASSYASNCSSTFVYAIGRLNFIYQKAIEVVNNKEKPIMELDELMVIGTRLNDAVDDPDFIAAKEKVLKEIEAKKGKEVTKKDDGLDMSTLGTSDEGYILIEDDDDDDDE